MANAIPLPVLSHGPSARARESNGGRRFCGSGSLLSLQVRLSGRDFTFLRFRRPSASSLQFSFVSRLFRCGHTHLAHGHSFRFVSISSLGICAPTVVLITPN